MASVEVEHLSKTFLGADGQPVRAVQDITLRVESGELLVLVGPSGCGKTTLLRLLAGLEEPTAGKIRLDGREVNGIGPEARGIAMVFQSAALYPHLTARENLAFGLKLRRVAKPERAKRVAEAAELLGLEGCLERRPMELSGGEKQRVALGRALVRQPKVVLLDEPLSNLDAPLRARMRLELVRLQQRLGTTLVYVTHDQAEAMALGRRLAVMKAGGLQQVGEPRQIYERPANMFVAGFLGLPPMNLFRGKVVEREGRHRFETAGELRLDLGAPTAEHWETHRGKEVVLGLRPEAIEVVASHADLVGAVELVESSGPDAFVHLRLGGTSVVARLKPGIEARAGQSLGARLDARQAHWFDGASGERLGTE